jgi:hypothetical protein
LASKLGSEFPAVINGTWRHLVRKDNAILNADTMILFAKSRCLVDNVGVRSDQGRKGPALPSYLLFLIF